MIPFALKRVPRVAAETIVRPFQEFTRIEAFGGILLLCCTLVALVWANSPWAASYFELWELHFRVALGSISLDQNLHFWINDGLMTIFFFVVGLEIKREVLVGELSSGQRAALPMAAALGGMIVPAVIYLALNFSGPGMVGWGIPMATDIAFALGVLTLLGSRVPPALKVFLTALAIVDDIGAVLVIAVFYTADLNLMALLIAAAILLALAGLNAAGIRDYRLYLLCGVALWLAVLASGVHATIAGVLLAMMIPASPRTSTLEYLDKSHALIHEFEREGVSDQKALVNEGQLAAVLAIERSSEYVLTPLQRMEHALHPWVTYAIMPLFALSNAGVPLGGNVLAALVDPIGLGILLGLVIGKQAGITAASWLAVRSGIAALPEATNMGQLYLVSWLGGIGFTMSLFIANLAFGGAVELDVAKVAILTASLIAGSAGYALIRLRLASPADVPTELVSPVPPNRDEAAEM